MEFPRVLKGIPFTCFFIQTSLRLPAQRESLSKRARKNQVVNDTYIQ